MTIEFQSNAVWLSHHTLSSDCTHNPQCRWLTYAALNKDIQFKLIQCIYQLIWTTHEITHFRFIRWFFLMFLDNLSQVLSYYILLPRDFPFWILTKWSGRWCSKFLNWISQRKSKELSEIASIPIGKNVSFPKSSILSSFLFLIYINNISNNVICNSKLFAGNNLFFLTRCLYYIKN